MWLGHAPVFQIAKSKGAYVVSTCSPATGTFVTSLGADATIDYRAAQPSLAAHLTATYPLSGTPNAPFDVVLDAVGSDVDALLAASPAFLAPHGMYVDVAGSAEIDGLWSTLCARARVAIRALRPAWLGGTARKYRFFLLPTPKMVRARLSFF
jgi:NADPH:quinone reductase-like Zn-dependent oxidoreductase